MAAPLASSVPSLSYPTPSSAPNPKPLRLPLALRPKSLSLPTFSSAPRNPRLASFSNPHAGPGQSRGRRRFPFNRRPNEEPASGGDVPIISDEWGEKSEAESEPPSAHDQPKDEDEWGRELGAAVVVGKTTDELGADAAAVVGKVTDEQEAGDAVVGKVTDELGEKVEAEPELPSEADPPKNEDEWRGETTAGTAYLTGNGSSVPDDKLGELKRCIVDMFYGTEFGLRMSSEDRAEVLELISQLEAENPTPAPTEAPDLLDGNWILLYTAFSELLPLLALGATPLLKIKRIAQAIDSKSMTIINATTLSSPFASFSFSASASFEVRTASRIQVKFTEGTFQPPEISSTVDLPETFDIFGQKIDLKPVQQTLNPIQEAVANISRAISGQPPLKVPLPGNRADSWLLTTYLDGDFRISRGDGGLFVLVKEGSAFLDQLS